jgi:ribosomal protein S27AE
MSSGDNIKNSIAGKDKKSMAKDFANQYMDNVIKNQIKVICPQCNMKTTIYPEHLDRACCDKCNVLLKVVDMV